MWFVNLKLLIIEKLYRCTYMFVEAIKLSKMLPLYKPSQALHIVYMYNVCHVCTHI